MCTVAWDMSVRDSFNLICVIYIYMSYVKISDRHIYKYVPLIQICLTYIYQIDIYISNVYAHIKHVSACLIQYSVMLYKSSAECAPM